MTAPVRWGILGNAKIARDYVAPAIHLAEGAALTVLGTGDPARSGAFTSRFAGLRVVEGYDAVLADPEVDAVYIPLPNHLHVEWTEKVLAAGKAVLCEKPIALRAPEIDRLIAARDAAGRLAAEAFMVVHHPQWQRARALVGEGAIGRLLHVEGAFTYRNTNAADIRNRPETGGGGLYDIGVYPAIGTRFVTGAEPLRARADIRREDGVDTFARAWLDFESFTLSFYCGMRQAPRQEMVFHGEDGWLRLTAPFNTRGYGDVALEIRREDGTMHVERYNAVDHYQLMIEAFGRSMREGVPFACPLEFSRGNQAMIDMIYDAGEA